MQEICIRRGEEVIKVSGKMPAGFFTKKTTSDLRKSQKTHTALMHSAVIYTERILLPVTKEGGPLTVENKACGCFLPAVSSLSGNTLITFYSYALDLQ